MQHRGELRSCHDVVDALVFAEVLKTRKPQRVADVKDFRVDQLCGFDLKEELVTSGSRDIRV